MTDESAVTDKTHIPDALIKHGTFEWPRSEARQTLGHLFEKIKDGFAKSSKLDAVDDQQLSRVSDDTLKSSMTEILTQSLYGLLDHQYLDWAKSREHKPLRRAFVYPPTCENTLDNWAARHGFAIFSHDDTLSDFSKDSCIVIPKLEIFFSRDYDQLADLFDLFMKLAHHDGPVLVGCNSWAWRFLKQFDDAHLLFADAYTFPAFDADALATVLERALTNTANAKTFTSVESGEPVLSRDDDDALKDRYLTDLAGLSLGHPVVAVEMLFRRTAEVKDEGTDQDRNKIWVDLPASCSLPAIGANSLLFALQALMIHGPRPVDELNALLPHRVPNGVWTELERAGFVELNDGTARCVISSYPDIRSELSAAGFNLDEL